MYLYLLSKVSIFAFFLIVILIDDHYNLYFIDDKDISNNESDNNDNNNDNNNNDNDNDNNNNNNNDNDNK